MAYNSFINKQAGTQSPKFEFKKDNLNAAITSGDGLGQFNFLGFDGTAYLTTSRIISTSSGTIAANRIGSNLEFYTHPDSVTASTQRMVITNVGEVVINNPDTTIAALLVTNNGTGPNINLRTANNGANDSPHVHFTKSRAGTADVQAGDDLGRLEFRGFQGGTAIEAADIRAQAETVNGASVSGSLQFRTRPTTYAAINTRMNISANGNVTINAPVSGTALTIVGGGETITAGDLTITSGNVYLPNTTSTPIGVVFQGGLRFIHTFGADGCTYIGKDAGSIAASNTSNNTTAVGRNCLTAITTGNGNTGVGDSVLGVCSTQGSNTGMGTRALQQSLGNNNTAIGFRASEGAVGSSAIRNTILGSTCGVSISSGGENVYIGFFAALVASTSAQNVVIGSQAFLSATTAANNNVVIGYKAGTLSTGFSQNTIVGTVALDKATTGIYNLALGYGSGTNYTGTESHNILLHSDGVLGDNNTLRIGQSTGTGTRQIQNAYIQGYVNLPGQPSFNAYSGADQLNVTGAGAVYTVQFNTERFDVANGYNPATGIYTALAAGKYMFYAQVRVDNITAAMTAGFIQFIVNGGVFSQNDLKNPFASGYGVVSSFQGTIIANLAAGDTVYVQIQIVNGAGDTADILTSVSTYFCGQLLS